LDTLTQSFDRDGYCLIQSLCSEDDCSLLLEAIDPKTSGAGSRRLLQSPIVQAAARKILGNSELARLLPSNAVAVQCSLFAKGPAANWSVVPHQDLSIPVAEQVDAKECSGWSVKEGVLFTQPPASVLSSLVAVRLQLDAEAEFTGPLRVLPGSHRLGRLSAAAIASRSGSSRPVPCVVPKGGAVVLNPLIVHSSGKAAAAAPRRVLHFLFGPPLLPLRLRWANAI
jgi:ectoine hydroxylase-related dioxygenase (phytanoyl-CoA dioxygenase family)